MLKLLKFIKELRDLSEPELLEYPTKSALREDYKAVYDLEVQRRQLIEVAIASHQLIKQINGLGEGLGLLSTKNELQNKIESLIFEGHLDEPEEPDDTDDTDD